MSFLFGKSIPSFEAVTSPAFKSTDQVATLQRDLANQKYVSYNTRPVAISHGADTSQFAAKHRLLFQGVSGGGGGGGGAAPGDYIAQETQLIHPRLTQDYVHARLDPEHRPFATVPYIGKGRKNVQAEFSLLRGARNPTDEELAAMKNKVIAAPVTHSFAPEYSFPEDKHSIPQMPKDWVRGGEVTAKRIPNK